MKLQSLLSLVLVSLCGTAMIGMELGQKKPDSVPYGWCVRANGKWTMGEVVDRADKTKDKIAWRDEDKVVCILTKNSSLTNPKIALLSCVFDGHGGDAISNYASKNIARIFNGIKKEVDSYTKLNEVIKQLSQEIDVFSKTYDFGYMGSTALVTLLEPMDDARCCFTVAWLGDSRAVVAKEKSDCWSVAYQTKDHTPLDPDEKKRVLAAGGIISRDGTRVGPLEVSRALGDNDYREYGITSVPETEQIILTAEENPFIILASDGVLSEKAITNEKAIRIVGDLGAFSLEQLKIMPGAEAEPLVKDGKLEGQKDMIQQDGDEKLQIITRIVCAKAIKKGSEDNVASIAIDVSKFMRESQKAVHDAQSEKDQLKAKPTESTQLIDGIKTTGFGQSLWRNKGKIGLLITGVVSIAAIFAYWYSR